MGITFIPNRQQDVPEIFGYILNEISEIPTVPDNLFTSSVQTCLTCNTCLNYSTSEETQHIIKVQVFDSIRESLSLFLREECLASQNAWFCSACDALRESSRRMYFVRAPTILFIQLMRFSVDNENAIVKLKNSVNCQKVISVWEEDG